MNKILVGLIVGAVLGLIDGATAWFTPEVRDQMLGIIIGSTVKGIIAGIAAGWYARRVQSVSKGIVFGFVVGLVLAFAVAAMPDANGQHYWWQIMVPGSILGGVIGWATQRYGRPASLRGAAAALAMFVVGLAGVDAYAHHDEKKVPVSAAAFEKLKALAGTWSATMLTPDGEKTTVVYRVTGNGSVVMETMFAGSDHEMINMYTLEGDSVIATHYCSAGNQPVLKLNAAKSSANELVFDFLKKTGKEGMYINGVKMNFNADGKVVEEWTSSSGAEHKVTLYLNSRK